MYLHHITCANEEIIVFVVSVINKLVVSIKKSSPNVTVSSGIANNQNADLPTGANKYDKASALHRHILQNPLVL